MAVLVRRTNRIAGAIILGVLTFLVTSGATLAADQGKKPPAKQAAKSKAPSVTKGASQKKVVEVKLIGFTEEAALATFDTFTLEWMQKLIQTENFHKSQAQVVESPDGFAVEYIGYIPDRHINVKKTNSSDTPYVGILTYLEKKLRCAGKTKEDALKGPFEQVETSPVSEIFRFTKGKWVY